MLKASAVTVAPSQSVSTKLTYNQQPELIVSEQSFQVDSNKFCDLTEEASNQILSTIPRPEINSIEIIDDDISII